MIDHPISHETTTAPETTSNNTKKSSNVNKIDTHNSMTTPAADARSPINKTHLPGKHTERIIKAGISVSMCTAFLPLFKSHQDGKYKQINGRVNYNDLKSDIVYSMINSIMGNPFQLVLKGQKKDFDNSDLEVFAFKRSRISEKKVSFLCTIISGFTIYLSLGPKKHIFQIFSYLCSS